MGPVEEFFTSRFLNLYGPPDAFDVPRFVAEYTQALSGNEPSLLKDAADRIIRQHKYRNWPTIGECLEAVEAVGEARMMARRREAWGYSGDRRVTPTAEEKARVGSMVERVREAIAKVGKPMHSPMPDTSRDAWEQRLARSATARALAHDLAHKQPSQGTDAA